MGGASRRAVSVAALAALVTGGLLAWALPALARSGPAAGRSGPAAGRRAAPQTPQQVIAAVGQVFGARTTTLASTPPPTARPTPTRGRRQPVRPVDLAGRWSAPFAVSRPADSDLIAPVLALAPGGRFAVSSGRTDEDAPSEARAAISTGTALDVTAPPEALSGVQQTLAAAYLNRQLVLVTGTSPVGDACCSSASTAHGIRLAGPQLLASNLEGTTTGALVPVRGGLLAAVDNQAGITVARSDARGVFSANAQLVASDPTPPLMAVSALADGGALVAWTAPAAGAQTVTGTSTTPGSTSTSASGYDQPRNQLIRFATSGPTGLPGAAQLAVTVPAGREIDALAAVPHRSGTTLAWTESWYAGARYESEVFWTDVGAGAPLHATALSPPGSAAVGVSLAGSPGGREVATWQACDVAAGTCRTDAALRPHGDAWGSVRSLGSVDPTSFPVAAESAAGQALVGWISGARVRAAAADPAATGFHPSVNLARVSGDANLVLGFTPVTATVTPAARAGASRARRTAARPAARAAAPATDAVAVWVQGTVDQKLVGARFTP